MAHKKLNPDQVKEMKIKYYNGDSVEILGNLFDLSVASVYNYLKDSPSRPHRKLTTDQVIEILATTPDQSHRQVAKRFGVSHETIRKVRKKGQ
tara:strand:+ start:3133 stop:3411 length:279 start_codon:yes stop_codon:yes gene_type:complete